MDERDGRRRPEDRRKERDDVRRRDREVRDYDSRYSRDREYLDRDRRRDERRSRRYDDYDIRDPYRREYYDDPYSRGYLLISFYIKIVEYRVSLIVYLYLDLGHPVDLLTTTEIENIICEQEILTTAIMVCA